MPSTEKRRFAAGKGKTPPFSKANLSFKTTTKKVVNTNIHIY